MRVVITGANGYIGEYALEEALKASLKVTALIKPGTKLDYPNTIEADILNQDSLNKAFQNQDVVIHLAGVVGAPSKEENYQVNCEGVKNVIKAAKLNGVKHLIFTSSVSAIRSAKGPYGEAKYQAELALINSQLQYTIFRPTIVYGVKSQGLARILQNLERFPLLIPLVGDANFSTQPIYVKDLANLLVKAVNNQTSKIYDAGGGEIMPFKEFLNIITKKLKIKKTFIPIPNSVCKLAGFIFEKTMDHPHFTREHIRSLSEHTEMDINPLIKDLDYTPTPLSVGLDETFRDMK